MTAGPARRLGSRLVLAAAALAVGLAALAALEGGLRLLGLGAPDPTRSRLAYQHVRLPVLGPGRRPDGTPLLRTLDARLPYQSVLAHKPEGSLRIFVFGGSAAAGLGTSPNVAFPRQLERMLQAALPGRTVEVVNFAVVAFASGQVRAMLADACRRGAPDLVVVYSGHNEFLEAHTLAYARARAGPLERALGTLPETHLYRLMAVGLHADPPPELADARNWPRLREREILPHIESTDDDVASVLAAYEAHLEACVRSALAARIPIVLMTAAANWRWSGTLQEQAASAETNHARLFRQARAHEQRGELEAARASYRAALDADPSRRRATDAAHDRVRAVARRHDVILVDTVAWLASRERDGIPGFASFYDHVHLTPLGHLRVAAALMDELQRSAPGAVTSRFDANAWIEARARGVAAMSEDALDAREWLGFGFDPTRLHERDLWKYERTLAELDEILASDPDHVRALVYRGNAASFRLDGVDAALRDWQHALDVAGDLPDVQANIARLLHERSPAAAVGS